MPIRHLDKVAEITDMLTKGALEGVTLFLEPLRELIELHGFPFVRERSFEALEFTKAQLSAISALSRAMEIEDVKIHREVAVAVSRFAIQANKGYSTNVQEKQLPFQIIAESEIVSRLVLQLNRAIRHPVTTPVHRPSNADSARSRGSVSVATKNDVLRDMSNFTEKEIEMEEIQTTRQQTGYLENALAWSKSYLPVTLAILEALKELSFHEGCAQLIVKADAIKLLCVILHHDPRSPLVKLAVEIIWNLLDICPSTALLDFGAKDANFEALSNLLLQLEDCYRLKDKELRNELAIVLCLLAREEKNHMSLVLNQNLNIAIYQSTKHELSETTVQGNSLSESDFEFKNSLWAFILATISCDLALSVIIEKKVPEALLVHIDPDLEAHPALKLLNDQQKVELKSRALQILMHLLPRAPTLYSKMGMHDKFTSFILVQLEKAGDGLQHMEVTQRLINLVLKSLCKVVSRADTTDVLMDVNDVRLLFSLFNDPENTPADRANAIRLLGLLCDHHPYNQRVLRKEGGIRAVASALQTLTAEGGSEVEMLQAIVQCVWCAIVGNPKNEAYWLRLNGVEQLLDTLCVCAPEMRAMTLGCLADLLLNPGAIQYFWDWKGNIGALENSALSLAAHIPNGVQTWGAGNPIKKKFKPREERKIDAKGSPAAHLLVRLWELHDPENEVSEVLKEIDRARKSRATDYDEKMAETVFNTLQADPDTGDYNYQTHVNGAIKSMARHRALDLKEKFDKLDADGSGELDIEELVPLARGLGKSVDPAMMSDLVAKIDIDGNGQINFIEVLAFLIVSEHYASEKEMKKNRRITPRGKARSRTRGSNRESKTSKPGASQGFATLASVKAEADVTFDEAIRHTLFAVVTLIGSNNANLNRDQRSQLKVIGSYSKLCQGLEYMHVREEFIAELKEEGLEPLESDLQWIENQKEGFEELVLKLKTFSFDDEAAELKIQANLLEEFCGSVKMKIEEKGRALKEEVANQPASVKQRKAAKDMRDEIIKASLDIRETLKRTLHCKEDDLDSLIAQTHAAKEKMRKKALESTEKET